MTEKDIHIQIQQYLDNSMSSKEKSNFEKELESNSELKKDFDLISDIESELGNEKLVSFKNILSEIVDTPTQENQKEGKRVFFSRRILSIAASLLLLAGLAFWMFSTPQKDYSSLADSNFVHFPSANAVRGEDQSDKSLFENYELKKYDVAAPKLKAEGLKTGDERTLLIAAISYLAIENSEEAILLLKKTSNTSILANKRNYYLGLAYLKKNQVLDAKNFFILVNESDQFFFKKSQVILKQLE